MPEANLIRHPGLAAAADLSAAANQFKGVKITAANRVNLCTVLGEFCFGVLYNKPGLDVRAEVVVEGSPKMQAGAAIVVGERVRVAADGQFVPAVSALGNTDHAVAVAITAAAAAAEIFQGRLLGGAEGLNTAVS